MGDVRCYITAGFYLPLPRTMTLLGFVLPSHSQEDSMAWRHAAYAAALLVMGLLAPDGTAVTAGDDDKGYFAAFQWPAAQTTTYRHRVTFFEALNSGLPLVSRR